MYDVMIFGPDGNGVPLAAGMGWWDAYCVAYKRAYIETLPGVEISIIESETGRRQFTFGGRRGVQ